MNAIKKFLGKYLNTWDEICLDDNARLRTNSIVFYFAIATIGIIMAIVNHDSISTFVYASGVVLATMSLLFAVLQMRDRRFSVVLSAIYFCYILVLSTGFILTSGEQDFSLMWLMIFPYVAWLVFNEVMALLFSALLLAITLVLLFFPIEGVFFRIAYESDFKHNFVAIMCFVFVSALLSDLIRMKTRQKLLAITAKLRKRAYEDSLTGIGNRHDFEQFLENGDAQCAEEVYYAVVDIDYFKLINDSWGHATGDEVLKAIGDVLRNSIRDCDKVFRWGGDEFLIVLDRMPAGHFEKYLNRIRENVEEMQYTPDDTVRISLTASIGGTRGRRNEPSGGCIRRADECLYEAKRKGRNRVVVYENLKDGSTA